MRHCTILLALFAAFALAFGTTANAGLIGVNFASNQSAILPSDVAGVDVAHANWNNAPNRSGSTSNITGPIAGKLVDDSGVDSGVTISWNNSSANATWRTNFPLNDGDDKMMKGYIDLGNSTPPGVTIDVSDLDQFASAYDVYVYAGREGGAADASVSNGTTTYGMKVGLSNSSSFPGDYALASTLSSELQANWDVGNYVLFEDMSGDSFTITYARLGPNSGVTGMQIVAAMVPPPPPSTGALVYESMSHPTGAGQLHGNTADTGLGAWNVNPTGSGQIISPGMGYTDGNGNVLPTAGNRYETVAGFNDLARASIDTTAWSDDNKDGGKLNAKGAEIWFSALMNAIAGGNNTAYNHFHLDFTDTANGNASWANGPGYFAVGKDTGSGVWEIRADNDDGDADVMASSTVACNADTFILGRFLTDATTGDTVFDAWFNPLLDTAPGGAGTGDLSILLAANDDGSVTQFDTLGYRHQKWESPNLLDEIRMGETFNSVVGLSTAVVPEPSTFALAALGLLGIGWFVRRRKR